MKPPEYPTAVGVLRGLRSCPQGCTRQELLGRLLGMEPERVGRVLDRLVALSEGLRTPSEGVLQVSGESRLQSGPGLPELAEKMSRLYRTLKEEGQVRDLVRLILSEGLRTPSERPTR
ncbi:MAG: hypothetical protein V3U31_08860 [Dehalococcoidia bacterium]